MAAGPAKNLGALGRLEGLSVRRVSAGTAGWTRTTDLLIHSQAL